MTKSYNDIIRRVQQIGFILECYLDFIELQYMNDDFNWFDEFPVEYNDRVYIDRCKKFMKEKDWDYFVRAISCRIKEKTGNLFFIFNGYDKDLDWKLPAPQAAKEWQVALSTENVKMKANGLKVPAWSVIVFKEMNKIDL